MHKSARAHADAFSLSRNAASNKSYHPSKHRRSALTEHTHTQFTSPLSRRSHASNVRAQTAAVSSSQSHWRNTVPKTPCRARSNRTVSPAKDTSISSITCTPFRAVFVCLCVCCICLLTASFCVCVLVFKRVIRPCRALTVNHRLSDSIVCSWSVWPTQLWLVSVCLCVCVRVYRV